MTMFNLPQKPIFFQDFMLHRILRHMHGALNIDENKLHILSVNPKTNLLSLVTL